MGLQELRLMRWGPEDHDRPWVHEFSQRNEFCSAPACGSGEAVDGPSNDMPQKHVFDQLNQGMTYWGLVERGTPGMWVDEGDGNNSRHYHLGNYGLNRFR